MRPQLLRDTYGRELLIGAWHEIERSQALVFTSTLQASDYLRSLALDVMNMARLRHVLADSGAGLHLSLLSDEEVLAILSTRLASGGICLAHDGHKVIEMSLQVPK